MSLRVSLACLVCLTLCAQGASAATQAQIDQAVQRGVQHLLNTQGADGSWNYPGYAEGATALAALALLESGAQPGDPAIQRAAQFVRARAHPCTQTYSLALVIFFLDRLGDKQDQPLIVTLGERLRNGQLANGAWTYYCSAYTTGGAALPALAGMGGDNSNTQFAILGLWVARRHNVEVKEALARTDQYFRASQVQDGGWSYIGLGSSARSRLPGMGASTGSMTCAGLLGLLLEIGNQAALRAGETNDLKAKPKGKPAATAKAAADPLKDPAVQKGLKCLEQFLTPQGNAANRFGLGTELYFLWSVERVAVAYDLKQIGTVDWYDAGADRILALQQADGSWADYAPSVGTSLALLFLKRANLAADLTRLVGKGSSLRSSRSLEDLKNIGESSGPVGADARPAPAAAGSAQDLAAMSPERLKQALPGLAAKQQTAVLEELRDRKGSEATLALAEAIGTLDEPLAAQARKLLTERLHRMTVATLVRYLEYEDDEIRLAATKAAGGKQDRALVGPLIELLEKRNLPLADSAHAALVELTGKQFGPFAEQTTANRFVVIRRWKNWWQQQAQKE